VSLLIRILQTYLAILQGTKLHYSLIGSVSVEDVEDKAKLLNSVEAHDYEIGHLALSKENMIATSDAHNHLKVFHRITRFKSSDMGYQQYKFH
jgi:hypothetical protein